MHGVRPSRTFREAAAKYLLDNQHKRSIMADVSRLKGLVGHIGDLPLKSIRMETLQGFIEARKKDGVKMRTINHGLKVVRQILNLASTEWFDEHGLTWLLNAPKIKELKEHDARNPYPLNWNEQQRLFSCLPVHLRRMALYAVNTGCRDHEICSLEWDWEVKVPELNTSVFIIPQDIVKNGEERLVVLNRVASSVIEEVRGVHPQYVFTYRGRPLKRMLSSGWRNARIKASLPGVRVHDLKHTYGRRLRASGVSFEDRQDLLGHKSGKITTHYSAAEMSNLIEASNRVCDIGGQTPILTLIKSNRQYESRKSPARDFEGVVNTALCL